MKLMHAELAKTIPGPRTTENDPDPVAVVKYFAGAWTWYATEYDPDQRLFFGRVDGFESELGYFGLAELEDARGPQGLRVERDLYFRPTRLSEIPRA